MTSKKITKSIFILIFIFFLSSAQAQEQIVGFQEKDLATLNEELRKLGLEAQITVEGKLDVHSKKVTNVATPTVTTDGANKGYVDGKFPVTAANQVNTSALYGTAYLPDATVDTTALKTATGEVSSSTSHPGQVLTLPGGTYGFYPQTKSSSANAGDRSAHINGGYSTSLAWGTSYATSIRLSSQIDTVYAQQRYVTASGEDLWVFLLIDKITKEIMGAYQAPDHPAYGNGGDFDKVQHPFGNYDESKYEVILVDNDTIAELKSKVTPEKSLLTLVNEEYRIAYYLEKEYKPLHSGRFLGEKPEIIKKIPDCIKVRSLYKMNNEQIIEKKRLAEQEVLEAKQDRESKKDRVKQKLGLSEEEFSELKEVL